MREAIATGSFLIIALGAMPASAEEAPPLVAPKQLEFGDAVKRAIEQNPNSVTAVEEIRRSEALVEEARAAWLPTLTGNATYTRLDSARTQAGVQVAGIDAINANLLLTVPIIAAKPWMIHARAKDNVNVAKLTANDAKVQVAVATGHAYLTIVAQKRVLETTVRARDNAKAHEDYAKQRFAGGIGNRLDAVRASQERATSETLVQQQLIALVKAQEALGVLVGENNPVDVTADPTFAALPSLAAALGEVDSKRSDVIAQRERAEVARKFVRDSYVEYLPFLTGVVEPFYQTPATTTFPTTGWQAQLVLSLPIYDGGNRYGLTHEREALHDEAKTRLEGALRQAKSDVRLAFDSVRRADDALGQAREASALGNEALELAQLAYKAGATSNLEVIDAERQARDADTAMAVAEDAARQARLDLLAACGRFP